MGRQVILTGGSFAAGNLPLYWTPATLGAALASWLKADTGVTPGTAGATSAIVDQATGLSLVQPTSANQPSLTLAVQNGKPALSSGTSTAQSLSTASNNAATAFAYNQPFTIAMAFKRVGISGFNGGNSWETLIANLDTTTPYRGWMLGPGTPSGHTLEFRLCNTNSVQASAKGSTVMVTGNKYIVVCTYSGSGLAAGIQIYINNVAETMTTVSDTLASNPTTSGSNLLSILGVNNLGGYQSIDQLLEAFVVNRLLTTTEIGYASQYLDTRFAIY